jgi:hypothetical protein
LFVFTMRFLDWPRCLFLLGQTINLIINLTNLEYLGIINVYSNSSYYCALLFVENVYSLLK